MQASSYSERAVAMPGQQEMTELEQVGQHRRRGSEDDDRDCDAHCERYRQVAGQIPLTRPFVVRPRLSGQSRTDRREPPRRREAEVRERRETQPARFETGEGTATSGAWPLSGCRGRRCRGGGCSGGHEIVAQRDRVLLADAVQHHRYDDASAPVPDCHRFQAEHAVPAVTRWSRRCGCGRGARWPLCA